MNEGFLSAVRAKVVEAAKASLERFARERIVDIQTRIGIPVERTTGRIVRSSPGEPPRKDSGDLWNSLQATEVVFISNEIDIFIFTTVPYAKWLEEGTDRGLEPRPWWEPSFQEIVQHVGDLKALFAESLGSRTAVSV